jgi:hypothetical protein
MFLASSANDRLRTKMRGSYHPLKDTGRENTMAMFFLVVKTTHGCRLLVGSGIDPFFSPCFVADCRFANLDACLLPYIESH